MTKFGKYVFTLKNIDVDKVDQKYGITPGSQLLATPAPQNSTKLSDLTSDRNTPEIVSFLDESKRLHQCTVSMIDFSSQIDINTLKYYCFWCRHQFNAKPIGCPIRFVPSRAVKTYYSEISKDVYTIKENVTENRADEENGCEENNTNLYIQKRGYYETDGVFCSFHCCKAFIKDNKHMRIYDKSLSLMMKMYSEMSGTNGAFIDEAPHWRQLRVYGGHMTIEEFRRSFNKAVYIYYGQYNKCPPYMPVGRMYEEKIKF